MRKTTPSFIIVSCNANRIIREKILIMSKANTFILILANFTHILKHLEQMIHIRFNQSKHIALHFGNEIGGN